MADATVAEGWFSRGYSWEFSAAVQHEVVPRVSANLSYHRRTSGTPFRSFSTGSTRTVQIIEPGLMYEPGFAQLDLRLTRAYASARTASISWPTCTTR